VSLKIEDSDVTLVALHKGHEDRGYFTESNEGNEGAFGVDLA
jgi:hypothetical protein